MWYRCRLTLRCQQTLHYIYFLTFIGQIDIFYKYLMIVDPIDNIILFALRIIRYMSCIIPTLVVDKDESTEHTDIFQMLFRSYTYEIRRFLIFQYEKVGTAKNETGFHVIYIWNANMFFFFVCICVERQNQGYSVFSTSWMWNFFRNVSWPMSL